MPQDGGFTLQLGESFPSKLVFHRELGLWQSKVLHGKAQFLDRKSESHKTKTFLFAATTVLHGSCTLLVWSLCSPLQAGPPGQTSSPMIHHSQGCPGYTTSLLQESWCTMGVVVLLPQAPTCIYRLFSLARLHQGTPIMHYLPFPREQPRVHHGR